MPPKRRQPRPPDPEPEPPRQASPPRNRDDDQPPPSEDEDEAEENDSVLENSPLPFYNTTFSAHRVSPLYLGAEPLTTNRLQLLAQRLRDRLVGDVVRGVEVGIQATDGGDSIIGRAGALERVEIAWVDVAGVLGFSGGDVESLGDPGEDEDGDDTKGWRQAVRGGEVREKRALHISLRYEMASCTALLLPALLRGDGETRVEGVATRFSVGGGADEMDWEQSVDPAHFLSLPLLLLRMPAPLKTIISEFLATTFDCRVSSMRLGTRSLVRSWEAWIRSAGVPSRGPLAKDMVLTLGFYAPPSDAVPIQPSEEDTPAEQQQLLGLKSIDVIIPAAELSKFAAVGKRLAKTQSKQTTSTAGWGWDNDPKKRRKLAGRLYEEGWEWRTASEDGRPTENQPFTEALACYLKEHLGLNLFHPGVRVVKIACGGFAMSESRLKLFAPAGSGDAENGNLPLLAQRGAVLELLGRLADKAQITVSV